MPANLDTPSDLHQLMVTINDSTNNHATRETQPTVRHSNRTQIPTTEFLQNVSQQSLTFEPQTIAFSIYYEAMHEDDCKLQDQMNDPIAFLTTTNKDTLYYHEAMKALDRDKFLTTMQKEFKSHVDKHHYKLTDRDDVPKGEDVLNAVWSMKQKRNILTNEIYKYKPRLNIYVGQQE